MPARLVDRAPVVPVEEIIAGLVAPPRFADARFDTYAPDPDQPSQAAAVQALQAFSAHRQVPPRRGILKRGRLPEVPPGVYLDGGFGVGKTYLLAALWHASPRPRAYGTFVELTGLVGVLGFPQTVQALSTHRLLCIDEFELDDPGDTVLVSSLLTQLAAAGVRLAATSNTQPEDLGAGRFAADAFRREIQGLSKRFSVVTVNGEDYRHRGLPAPPPPATEEEVERSAALQGATLDDFPCLLTHLAGLHPSRYGRLVDDVSLVALRGVGPVTDQDLALRLVVLIDRLYDRDVPVVASGAPVDALFPAELLEGPYRKKYSRAYSRLAALTRQGSDR